MQVEEVRRRSTQLFGNMYRLEVVDAILLAAGESVTASSVHEETGIKYPRVQEELKRLTDAGVLRQKPARRGQPVEYKAEPTTYFELCKSVLGELRGA